MLYALDVTVPKATLKTLPYEASINLSHGEISRISVEFPEGCAELVGIQLWRGPFQLFPRTPGQYISWDTGRVDSDEGYKLDELPYSLTIKGVNYDALNDHTVTVYVNLLPTSPRTERSIADLLVSLL